MSSTVKTKGQIDPILSAGVPPANVDQLQNTQFPLPLG